VFLKSRVMTCNVGDPWWVIGVWFGGGLLALAGALCYAEICAMMPESGGDYVFMRRAYGRLTSFLFGWTVFAIMKTGSQAALAVGFAIFLNVALAGQLDALKLTVPLPGLALHLSGISMVALGILWLVTLANCVSVSASGNTASVLTIVKVGIVLAVAVCALHWGHGDWSHLAGSGISGSCEGVQASARGGIAGVGAAMLGALWAYDGWNNVAPLSGEVRDPQRNLPKMFLGGIFVVIALYVAVNLAYFYVLTAPEIASVSRTSSVATEVIKTFVGPAAVTLVAVALMFSSMGSLHASVLANSRVPFAMARDGLFFSALAKVAPRSRVPVRAVLAQSLWASVLTLSGSYDTLTDSVTFASWLFYGLSAGSLFIFRRKLADLPRPYRAWGYPVIPAIFIAVTAALIVTSFMAAPRQALAGLALIVAGLPFYFCWTRGRAGASIA
jgi:APA family basic amino acid/polyamine antiporter